MKEYIFGSARVLHAAFGILLKELVPKWPPARVNLRQEAAKCTPEACARTLQ
jgi:hypothetical protein